MLKKQFVFNKFYGKIVIKRRESATRCGVDLQTVSFRFVKRRSIVHEVGRPYHAISLTHRISAIINTNVMKKDQNIYNYINNN